MKKLILVVAMVMTTGPAWAQQYTGPRAVTPNYTTGGYQASNLNGRYAEPGNPLQQRAAANLAAQAGIECNMASAAVLKETHKGGINSVVYEIACKNDFGWILTKSGEEITAYECVALAASEKAAKGKLVTCRLAENVLAANAGLAKLAGKAGLTCTPVQGNYLGGGGAPPISRYEVLCDNGAGYIIDTPQPKSSASVMAMSCAKAKAAGMGTCALKPARG
ncbi:hypothetical protein [Caulobacter sp.]|jgi:hypothetical protein|uniref:hypothetical protein n=1 Tax=Caulobacter sp. TaxID=78 RepID=UPI00161473B9